MDSHIRTLSYPIGTQIAAKPFNSDALQHGQVTCFDPFYDIFLILYNDGDREEMDLQKLERYAIGEKCYSVYTQESIFVSEFALAERRKSYRKHRRDVEQQRDSTASTSIENEEETDAEEQLDNDEMPSCIKAIIRYMDKLEPGENYFQRQTDNRGGCSRIRRSLLQYQRENKDDPAIAWHKPGYAWRPPDMETLNAIIGLFKKLILEMPPRVEENAANSDRAAARTAATDSESDGYESAEEEEIESEGKETEEELDNAEMPLGIKSIIRYMDKLEPGKNYFRRQMDSRGGCSRTRSILRQYQRENKTDIAVAWHEINQPWHPPDRKTLDAFVELLRKIISEMPCILYRKKIPGIEMDDGLTEGSGNRKRGINESAFLRSFRRRKTD